MTDLNKDIGSQSASGIIYNHLDLPWQISFRSATGTKGTITYIYDATGNKLKKTTMDSAGNLETVTTYIGPFQYQAVAPISGPGSGNLIDSLKFFAHSEGRVRVEPDTTGGLTLPSFKYDYFLKDHLGNTRMVLTDEQQTDMYPAATMEVGDSATENMYYSNLDSTRSTLPPGYPTDTTTNPNNYVAKLSASSSGPVIGPGIMLKVMAGDEFSIRVSSWYRLNGSSPGTPVNPVADIVTHLISGMAGLANPENPGLSALQSNTPILSSNVLQFVQDTGTNINSSKPHAFVNWILLDNQFNYVAASSGFSQVGNDQELHVTTLTNLPVSSSGYLYIYTSNEDPVIDVFFDNLQVTHTRGPLLEEDHYYPFGLTMAGISDKALKTNYAENKYRYNRGSELQNKEFSDGSGLEMYETKLRELDPQLGRWWQIDPKPNMGESPYASIGNDPILHNDPFGDTLVNKNDQKIATYMQSDFQKTKDKLTKERDAKQAQATSGKNGDKALTQKQIARLNKEVTNLTGRIGEVQKSMDNLSAVIADQNHGYTFNDIGSSSSTGQTFVNSSGYIEMDYLGNTSSFAHELAHGSGVAEGIYTIAANAAGQLGFKLPKGMTLGMFEIRGYRAQYGIDPGSMPSSDNGYPRDINEITEEYIYGIKNPSDGSYLYPRPSN